MRFCASSVSGSAAGDYYQLFLGPEETDDSDGDPLEAKGPYLIVQKQFEFPNQGRSYIETHDEHYVGHFHFPEVGYAMNIIGKHLCSPKTVPQSR